MNANKNFRRLVGWKTTFLACFEEKQIWKMISERVCLGWDDCLSHLCSWQLGPIDGNSDNFFIIVMMVVMVIIMIMITHNFHGFASNVNKLVGGSEYIVSSVGDCFIHMFSSSNTYGCY